MKRCDFVIAFGGGKAVDLGKGVATVRSYSFRSLCSHSTLDASSFRSHSSSVSPSRTLASNDAPTSSLSVIYDEKTDERQGAYFNYKKSFSYLVFT